MPLSESDIQAAPCPVCKCSPGPCLDEDGYRVIGRYHEERVVAVLSAPRKTEDKAIPSMSDAMREAWASKTKERDA